MNQLLPHRFLFRYSLPAKYSAKLPLRGKALLKLSAAHALPDFSDLDSATKFGDIRLAWNEQGIGIAVKVTGKSRPTVCRAAIPTETDGLQVWIDTRNTQNIHRASRFCHHFAFLPAGDGPKGDQPSASQLAIARAREDAPQTHINDVQVRSVIADDGYQLETWIPASALHGFDPESTRQLGFYYLLQDSELGQQYPSVGPDFPIAHDPSLWVTVELAR